MKKIYVGTPRKMINDPEARSWWEFYFRDSLMVEWDIFYEKWVQKFPEADGKQLQAILDHNDTGYVSQYKFSEFLKGFGPFSSCHINMKSILSEKWFHGFLSSKESELLLTITREPDGTFLIRFSKSKPGSFALAFMKSRQVRHILIESCMPEGLKISDSGSGNIKTFKSLTEIIDPSHFVLKRPFISSLPSKVWFHGDIVTEEANDLLHDQEKGTYLVRFSSKGCYAASFVDAKNTVRHVLIELNYETNLFEVNTGEGERMTFKTIKELVNHYISKGVFRTPLKQNNKL